jgi:serine/threonine-protein kinase
VTGRDSTQTTSAPTALVAGKYRLTRLLGRGGMGSVWEGVHETLGTRVAVKLIEIEHVQSGDSRRRFENEARAAAKLQSKHVVEVYDYGVGPEGHPFIVMQYLAGEPLDKRLERLGRLSPLDTARIVLQICRALARAHSLGIIHRDLKPENVFLVRDDEDATELVKVVDFGIAKVVGGAPEESATRTGSVLGTPYYMSPEQARGLRSVDHRSDLWSVGVIAFRCMVGRLPFQGEAVGDVLVNLCTGPIPIPSEIVPNLPPGFDGWVARALSRLPSERYSSAHELGEALAVVCGLTQRIAPITGDLPTYDTDPAIRELGTRMTTPAPRDENAVVSPLHPASKSARGASSTQVSASGLTGNATSKTPSPPERQNLPTIIVATVIATLIVAVGIAALARIDGGAKEPSQPAVQAAPAAAEQAAPSPGASDQAPVAQPTAAALPQALPDPAAVPADGAKAEASSEPVAAASKPPARKAGRPAVQATTRPTAQTPPPQGLDIRLER